MGSRDAPVLVLAEVLWITLPSRHLSAVPPTGGEVYFIHDLIMLRKDLEYSDHGEGSMEGN